MHAGDGPDDRDKTQCQQHPVKSLEQREGCFRGAPSLRLEPLVEEQRLGDEQHQREQEPDQDHRVEPPIFDGQER